jgi:hypothetical protein
MVIGGVPVRFGGGWQKPRRGEVSQRQAVALAQQGGVARLRNRRSGWLALTANRVGFTDVLTVSPDGRRLHYIVSITANATKTRQSTTG